MTRRQWLAASAFTGALASLPSCNRHKRHGYFGYALIATSGENSLAAVDLTTFRLAKPIPLGAAPAAVFPAHSPYQAYVLTPLTGSVHIVDGNLTRTLVRRFSDQLSAIRQAPEGGPLLAISPTARELIQADPVNLQIVHRHRLAFEPTHLDVTTAGLAAVSSATQGAVEIVNIVTGARTHAQMPAPMGAIRFRADGRMLLAANLKERSITALAVPSLKVVVELPLAMQPENLCFNADQGQLFVTGSGMDGVAVVFPYNTLEVDQTLLAGRDPGVMACSADPAYLFVGSASGSDVCVIGIDNRRVIGLVETGSQPSYITTTPDSQYALILNESSGVMAVIHIPAIHVNFLANRLKTGAALFTVIGVGEKPLHAAVVPRRS